MEIYLFGGFPKDIYLKGNNAIPRDIDLIVNGNDIGPLSELFSKYQIEKSRFGGLKIKYYGLDVDIWTLNDTWAFKSHVAKLEGIDSISKTTFLNIEAIAVELFPKSTKRKVVLDGFFEAIENHELELNLEKNPFPELNIARALYAAKNTDYHFGPKLISFIASNLNSSSEKKILSIYKKRYGMVEREKKVFQFFLKAICENKKFDGRMQNFFRQGQANLFEKKSQE
jgi:hypothetical protein